MPETKRIEVMENIYDANDAVASGINAALTARGVFAVNVMGAPGAGKTSVIRGVVERMPDQTCTVVEGDIESDIDTQALRALGIHTVQINTHGECHLDAPLLKSALDDAVVPDGSIVYIENIGNLVCPAEFLIGEHVKMLVVTVTDGSDKPYKYPLAFEKAGVIVLNKVDLLPYVRFDEEFFLRGVRALNPDAPVIKVSSVTGEGFDGIVEWLRAQKNAGR